MDPSHRILGWAAKAHAGLDELLGGLTGWASRRIATVLAVAAEVVLAVALLKTDAPGWAVPGFGMVGAWFLLVLREVGRQRQTGTARTVRQMMADRHAALKVVMSVVFPPPVAVLIVTDGAPTSAGILIGLHGWLWVAAVGIAWTDTPGGRAWWRVRARRPATVGASA